MVPKKKFFLSITLIFIIANLFLLASAEASSQTWSQTYGGTEDDRASSVVVTSDGGYAIAGYTSSFGAGSIDFWLIKTDEFGNMEWNQTYGGETLDLAYSLIETTDGGYALAGYTNFGAGFYPDLWLIKTDEFGNMLWSQTYGGTDWDSAYSLVEASDGGYVLAGSTSSFGAGSSDFWLIKTDEFGNMEWNQTYGGNNFDRAHSLVEASDGGYAIAGETDSFGAGSGDFWLIKTDEFGNMEWNQTYGGNEGEEAYSLVEASDGGYVLAGYTSSFGAGSGDFWLVKTDEFGNMLWSQTYGGNNFDRADSVVEASDGGYAIAGSTSSFGPWIIGDFWLIRTDEFGNMEWNQTYGEYEDDEEVSSLVEASDGGYAIAGYTLSLTDEEADFWFIKTVEMGVTTEFPLWIILLLLLIAILILIVIILIYKKQRKNKS